jgi:hypothetical protein
LPFWVARQDWRQGDHTGAVAVFQQRGDDKPLNSGDREDAVQQR